MYTFLYKTNPVFWRAKYVGVVMLQEWKDKKAPNLAEEIMAINKPNITGDTISGFGMKRKVATFIDLVRSAMYPNIYDSNITKETELRATVTRRFI